MVVRVGVFGVGNIASLFVQSIYYARGYGCVEGAIHDSIGGFSIGDIEVVYAVDVSREKAPISPIPI